MTVSNDAGSLDLVDFFGFSLSSFLFFDLHKGFKSKESGTQALSEIFSHISPASKWYRGRISVVVEVVRCRDDVLYGGFPKETKRQRRPRVIDMTAHPAITKRRALKV